MVIKIDAATAKNTRALVLVARRPQIAVLLFLGVALRGHAIRSFLFVGVGVAAGNIVVLLVVHDSHQVTFNMLQLVIVVSLSVKIRLLKRRLCHEAIRAVSAIVQVARLGAVLLILASRKLLRILRPLRILREIIAMLCLLGIFVEVAPTIRLLLGRRLTLR